MTIATGFNTAALAEQDRRERRERDHQELLARRRAYRRSQVDLRTRLGRRQRALERDLRAELVRQGRTITVHDDGLIGHLANLLVQREVLAGMQSRGEDISREELTRVINAAGRVANQLGLRTSVIRPPKESPAVPSLGSYLNRVRDRTGEA